MNKNTKKKLNLNRETLVELEPDTLATVIGGEGKGEGEDRTATCFLCVPNTNATCLRC
jgi:hypothetical protein